MKLAVLSGKGGAGKTMVAVNLAAAAGQACYIDCDVEEPNGRLFWKPEVVKTTPVFTKLPDFDPEKCTGCKECVSHCRFHALIYIKEKPMLFPEVCHSCGLCSLVCPAEAVSEREKSVGRVETGFHGAVKVVTGVMNPGEASGIPVIAEALRQAEPGLTVIDCPPGSSCSVMECIRSCDACILVAEPTAFGFHNFRMVHELATLLGKPCGVVINKMDTPYEPLEAFCTASHLPVLARIPYDSRVAELAAGAEIIAEHTTCLDGVFDGILTRMGGAVQ